MGKLEAALIKITFFIPFFTALIMFLRVGMLNIPFWEVGLSSMLTIITIVLSRINEQ
jgi:ABC-2 type transport system permease protein